MLNTERKKKYKFVSFYRFFWKAIFDKSAHQGPHFVSHSNWAFSRHNTTRGPQRGGGGYSDLFFIRSLGSRIYRSSPKNIRSFKHPKKYSSYPPKIFIFLKIQKNIEIQNFEPKKWPKPTYVWKYQSTLSDEHSRVDSVWRIQTAFST